MQFRSFSSLYFSFSLFQYHLKLVIIPPNNQSHNQDKHIYFLMQKDNTRSLKLQGKIRIESKK
nr:MAG TPA: hypothetical protein [Caudoviricetes sp.]